jgi:predicted metallopeptidase
MSDKTYSRVTGAEAIIKKICEMYPDVMWAVKPDQIVVLGIDNKERGKKNKKLARIIPIKGPEKAVFNIHNIPVNYVIELYWSDYNNWSENMKQWVMFHELLHISMDEGKTVKHDLEDFRLVISVLGVDWTQNKEKLPSLFDSKIEFNLDLRPNVAEYEEENKEAKEDKQDE